MFLEDENYGKEGTALNPLAPYTLFSCNTCLPSPRVCECFFPERRDRDRRASLDKKILVDATGDFSLIPFLWIYLDFSRAISNLGSNFFHPWTTYSRPQTR